MKYTAISIGPIIATLSQVRKPRELWSASYLFSHLMSIIIKEGIALGGELISPAINTSENPGIGLYPDRAFFKNELNLNELTNKVLKAFSKSIGINIATLNNYCNIMCTSICANEESEAIAILNKKLDALELANRSEVSSDRAKVLKLIAKRKNSPLFDEACGKNKNFEIPWIALIAANELKYKSEEAFNKIVKAVEIADSEKMQKEALIYKQSNKISEEDYWDFINESDFYRQIRENSILNEHFKSYHKYFCVVQADGDRMGSVIANLQDGEMKTLSESLIDFGKDASAVIKKFGGLPIYVGGDDLLFLAPVVSEIIIKQENQEDEIEKTNIFGLIAKIDELYQSVITKANDLQKAENKETTSMSYGISISYYKQPLYEVLGTARTLLFEIAKEKRNTITCKLQKHSGSALTVTLHKSEENLQKTFDDLIDIAIPENMVSATAHKLRENETLWQVTNGEKNRIDGFFQNIMGLGEKENEQNNYLAKVKELMLTMFATKTVKEKDQQLYAMLRIAKFINGEEVKDE